MPLKINGYWSIKPLDHNEPVEFESDNETAEVEIDLELSNKRSSPEPSTRKLIPK
jgi:hypothetical protein